MASDKLSVVELIVIILIIIASICLAILIIYAFWIIFEHFKSQIESKADEEAIKEI